MKLSAPTVCVLGESARNNHGSDRSSTLLGRLGDSIARSRGCWWSELGIALEGIHQIETNESIA